MTWLFLIGGFGNEHQNSNVVALVLWVAAIKTTTSTVQVGVQPTLILKTMIDVSRIKKFYTAKQISRIVNTVEIEQPTRELL